jgi:putative transposase
MVVYPRPASNLSTWMQWLTVTPTHRWHRHYHSAGQGPLYQGRFKSFPIQDDGHFLTAMRYVEAEPLRAKLVDRAESWRWGSLWRRARGSTQQRAMLAEPPVALPQDWLSVVNGSQEDAELEEIRPAAARGSPLGDETWCDRIVKDLGLQSARRRVGRPKKSENSVLERVNAT